MSDGQGRMADANPPRTSLRQAAGTALRSACSFPALLGLLLAAASFVATGWQNTFVANLFREGDTWFHVAVGEQILATGHCPTTDHYTFSAAGLPWIADQWLGDVAMALAARLDGLRGLAILLVLLSATLVLLIYYYPWLRGRNAKAAAIASALVLPIVGPFFPCAPRCWDSSFWSSP